MLASELREILKKMKSVLKNKAGMEFYSTHIKDDFDLFPDIRTVDVFDKETLESKKYFKKFLSFVSAYNYSKIKSEQPKSKEG